MSWLNETLAEVIDSFEYNCRRLPHPTHYAVFCENKLAVSLVNVSNEMSQADIDAIRTQFYESLKGAPSGFRAPIFYDSCNHDWQVYQGFTESYCFCTKCDIKAGGGA